MYKKIIYIHNSYVIIYKQYITYVNIYIYIPVYIPYTRQRAIRTRGVGRPGWLARGGSPGWVARAGRLGGSPGWVARGGSPRVGRPGRVAQGGSLRAGRQGGSLATHPVTDNNRQRNAKLATPFAQRAQE